MTKSIIHISDLHISHYKDSNGDSIERKDIMSFFSTEKDDTETNAYLDKIISHIKTNNVGEEFYLIVTGDLTDKGLKEEFEKGTEILNKICEELKIPKNKVLIVPGDHDVNWDDCKNAYAKIANPNEKKAYDCHTEKLKNYKLFIDDFYQDSLFNPNNAISRTMDFEGEILFIGLNSNFKVGTKPALGFIPKEKLEEEIKALDSEKPKIGVFHHNFKAEYENKAEGQWIRMNLNQVKELLISYDTRVVFYGNEHTPSSSNEKQFDLSSCGALGCKHSSTRSFKIYKLNNKNNGLSLDVNLISQRNHGNRGNYTIGYFDKESEPENEIKKIIIKQPPAQEKEPLKLKKDLPHFNKEVFIPQVETNFKNNLFEIVKEKNLFHSGHFHWSETSRAHNWIDVTKILNNHKDLTLAKDSIIDLINKNTNAEFDFIIGLGIEGNILSTKVSVKYNKPYSFLPYSYRYEDHNDSEKELNFKNEGQYKTVLIITDVVNDGRTIRKLIHKRSYDFFKDVEKIYVISLFYTGDIINKKPSMLNLDSQKMLDLNIIGDHLENRIEYFYVLDMKVEKCPYGENYRDECLIMREPSLGCIHKFYDEKNIDPST